MTTRSEFEPPPGITDTITVLAWQQYEAQNKLAALQYERWPSSMYHGDARKFCACDCGCINRTESVTGRCQRCRS